MRFLALILALAAPAGAQTLTGMVAHPYAKRPGQYYLTGTVTATDTIVSCAIPEGNCMPHGGRMQGSRIPVAGKRALSPHGYHLMTNAAPSSVTVRLASGATASAKVAR